jgi:hypothetical protein
MGRSKKNWDQLVKRDGNYGIDISRGIWPGSELDSKGDKGEPGDKGDRGRLGIRGKTGDKGEPGATGQAGGQGPQGDSAYQVALDEGFTGTKAEWLESLKGETGATGNTGGDAYDVYYNTTTDDPKLTVDEWLDDLKGQKGEVGVQGPKGEASGIFKFQGQKPNFGEIQALDPNNLEPGDVYQDATTDDLYVWDGTDWVLLTEALEVVKGQKGEEGPSAYDLAVKGGFTDTEAAWLLSLKGDEGAEGAEGPSAFDIAVKGGFQGDEAAWLETLKGEEGEQGDRGDHAYETAVKGGFNGTPDEWVASLKGDVGDIGPEGPSAYDSYFNTTSDSPPLSETAWLDSLKGDPGEDYDPLVLDDYYTSSQVDQLLEQLPKPGAGNNINSMPDENVFEPGDTLNFLNPDQQAREYNEGIITAALAVNVIGGPDGVVPPFAVTNTVLRDDTNLKGSDYTVFQELVETKADGGATYSRTAVPGQNQFGEWTETSFDSDSYYTKSETDFLVGGIEATLSHEAGSVKLTQSNSGETSVKLEGTGGIAISSGTDGIVIDGSALTPTPQFLGILQETQNPTALQPTPADGEYFLYGYTGVTVGTDPDGQDCTPGDWCVYNTDKWVHLDVSSDPGVVDVFVNGGLLTINKTNASQPDIGLDLDDIINDTNLDDYAKKEYVDALELNDLSNVNAPGASEGNALVYDSVKGEWVPGAAIGDYLPLTGGKMEGDIDMNSKKILSLGGKTIIDCNALSLNGSSGAALSWDSSGGNLKEAGNSILRWNSEGLTLYSDKNIKLYSEGTADDHVVTKAYVDAKASESSIEPPFIGAVYNFFDDVTGTFPDADIDATKYGEADNSYTWKSTGELVISTRGKSKGYENPAFDIEWDRVEVGDKLVFAVYTYSKYHILGVRSIALNTAGTAYNISYALLGSEGGLTYNGTKYNVFHFPAETGESELLELLGHLSNGVLYASGDQDYTGTLTFNSGDFKVSRSDGDYSITAGYHEGTPFIAVKDNEILTLGGLKAREEAEGAPLRLDVTTNTLKMHTKTLTEGRSFSIGAGSTQTDSFFKLLSKAGSYAFHVDGSGKVMLGSTESYPFIATQDHHATTKKFTDDNYAPRNFRTLPELD